MTACTSKQDLDAFGYLKDVELIQDPMDFRTFDLKFVCPLPACINPLFSPISLRLDIRREPILQQHRTRQEVRPRRRHQRRKNQRRRRTTRRPRRIRPGNGPRFPARRDQLEIRRPELDQASASGDPDAG